MSIVPSRSARNRDFDRARGEIGPIARMAVITAISAMLAVPIGLFLSVAFDPSFNPSIVLVPAGFFALSLASVVIKDRG